MVPAVSTRSSTNTTSLTFFHRSVAWTQPYWLLCGTYRKPRSAVKYFGKKLRARLIPPTSGVKQNMILVQVQGLEVGYKDVGTIEGGSPEYQNPGSGRRAGRRS